MAAPEQYALYPPPDDPDILPAFRRPMPSFNKWHERGEIGAAIREQVDAWLPLLKTAGSEAAYANFHDGFWHAAFAAVQLLKPRHHTAAEINSIIADVIEDIDEL